MRLILLPRRIISPGVKFAALDLLPLDLVEARVMAEARAASAVPVRTAVDVAP